MKIHIKIDRSCYISFGKSFMIYSCLCVLRDELDLSEEFYIPKTNISKHLQYAYDKFAKRMKMRTE